MEVTTLDSTTEVIVSSKTFYFAAINQVTRKLAVRKTQMKSTITIDIYQQLLIISYLERVRAQTRLRLCAPYTQRVLRAFRHAADDSHRQGDYRRQESLQCVHVSQVSSGVRRRPEHWHRR
jgi:hypothetical protein